MLAHFHGKIASKRVEDPVDLVLLIDLGQLDPERDSCQNQ